MLFTFWEGCLKCEISAQNSTAASLKCIVQSFLQSIFLRRCLRFHVAHLLEPLNTQHTQTAKDLGLLCKANCDDLKNKRITGICQAEQNSLIFIQGSFLIECSICFYRRQKMKSRHLKRQERLSYQLFQIVLFLLFPVCT